MPDPLFCFTAFADYLRLSVHLVPASRIDAIEGLETDASGTVWLKIRVNAPPEKGKANRALIALLAKRLNIPKSTISLLSGDTQRKKILRLAGKPEDLINKLTALLKD